MSIAADIRGAVAIKGGAAALASAQEAIACGDVDGAIAILAAALDLESSTPYHSDLLLNLAAALCQRAQNIAEDAAAVPHLDRAIGLLDTAISELPARTRQWALAKANQAVALLTRASRSGARDDLLRGHLALDSAEAVFVAEADSANLNWTRAIRDHLVELHDRRTRRR